MEKVIGNVAVKAFVLIFLAEMGDKTQLMSMALAARHQKPLLVFAGAVSALAVVTLIGVLVGEALTRVIPPHRIHQLAGVIFIAVGVLMLLRRI